MQLYSHGSCFANESQRETESCFWLLISFCHVFIIWFTLREANIAMENGPGLQMYFVLKTGIFHSIFALVYQRVISRSVPGPVWDRLFSIRQGVAREATFTPNTGQTVNPPGILIHPGLSEKKTKEPDRKGWWRWGMGVIWRHMETLELRSVNIKR